jgi:hypothetical protein
MTKEEAMVRSFALVAGCVVVLVVFAVGSLLAEQFGTAEEAKAMLERAVAAVKEDKAKALDMFNNGEGGSRIETFMCGAPTPRTASSRRSLT